MENSNRSAKIFEIRYGDLGESLCNFSGVLDEGVSLSDNVQSGIFAKITN